MRRKEEMMPITPHGATPVLHVTDLKAAIAFYTDVLGGTKLWDFENRYAGVQLGKVEFHVSQGTGMFNKPIGGANLYFFVDSPADVDAAYEEIVAKGGKVNAPPADYPYGMRDFVAFDPDGNMLTFGASTE